MLKILVAEDDVSTNKLLCAILKILTLIHI